MANKKADMAEASMATSTVVSGLDRRHAMKMLLALSATSVASTALSGCVGGDASDTLAPISAPAVMADASMALLTALADTIIPTTDTPGAVAANVPSELGAMYKEWGDDAFRQTWASGLARLEKTFITMGGQPFAKLSPKQREALLSKYDADVFDGKTDDAFYKDMKATVATAYYMSEPGATEELIYEAVPGEWKGCVPFSDIGRTWAT
ncbi:gluconate 2-dehydrogenase subunit 3 family protein [Fretibacter rubidus]|uniref:gluconate 2-dehydrogenase subunit 3 family protein n=1 Tax=Fretibacter rubidus TaxID=570162 RepID=UPI00352ADBA4